MTLTLSRIEQGIPRVATGLVLVIVAASFALSYTALVELSIAAGIPATLAPLWPLCLDAFMAVASLVVLRRELDGQPTRWAWTVVGAVTVLSIAFNVVHAPHNLISQAVYALPPAVVFASFEMLMSLIKMDIRRTTAAASVHVPATGGRPVSTGRPSGASTVDGADNPAMATAIPAAAAAIIDQTGNDVLDYYRKFPGQPITTAAQALGISRTTVRRRVNALMESGHLVLDARKCIRVNPEVPA